MIAAIVVAFYLGALTVDFRYGMRNAKVWDKVLYLGVLTLGLALVLLHEFGIELGSPLAPIHKVIRMLFNVD